MTRIVLATGNRDKVRELTPLLPGATLETAPEGFDPDETGTTYHQNALIKASALRDEVGGDAIVIADDSGLSVHGLDGRPGIFSARYAGPGATYRDNCELLLREMEGLPDRSAAFVCVLVALHPDGRRLVAGGTCPGLITESLRGSAGFGYDPVFQPLGDPRTMAEMSPQEKAALSHRGRAARRMAALLGLQGPA